MAFLRANYNPNDAGGTMKGFVIQLNNEANWRDIRWWVKHSCHEVRLATISEAVELFSGGILHELNENFVLIHENGGGLHGCQYGKRYKTIEEAIEDLDEYHERVN